MEDGHIKSVDEVLNYFGTDLERGLSIDQIKRNQAKYGPNGKLSVWYSTKHIQLSAIISNNCIDRR